LEEREKSQPSSEIVSQVRHAFLIFPVKEFIEPLEDCEPRDQTFSEILANAIDGLRSSVIACGLPFQLVTDSVQQRRFDRFHAAERIRGLSLADDGSENIPENQILALSTAQDKFKDFLDSDDGRDFMRDQIVFELERRLRSPVIVAAAQELLVQALISTWSVFESFARAFIISWINADPQRAIPVLASADMKEYFGKQAVDIRVIGDHGFDLKNSMGTILFRGKRLDNLGVIRSTLKALFNNGGLQSALDQKLWQLNQRRHLFVHNRGIVDNDYLRQTGDTVLLGERLKLKSGDIEIYLLEVRAAILAISRAADER
jgi:hypothetical protein